MQYTLNSHKVIVCPYTREALPSSQQRNNLEGNINSPIANSPIACRSRSSCLKIYSEHAIANIILQIASYNFENVI